MSRETIIGPVRRWRTTRLAIVAMFTCQVDYMSDCTRVVEGFIADYEAGDLATGVDFQKLGRVLLVCLQGSALPRINMAELELLKLDRRRRRRIVP
jgi:hypothetical protein